MSIKFKTAAVAAVLSLSATTAYAARFNDIPATHWAYTSIESIASMGLISGDSQGNFNPDDYIDKFSVSGIIAQVLGYDYNGASQAEKDNLDSIYNNYKTYLDGLSSAYSRWNNKTDKEIAYLLSKNFLTTEDINKFILVTSDGTEKLRAISREETADFFVRLLGKTTEAQSYKNAASFSDDSSISDSVKGSVYYLKSIGVISGASDGKYNPKAGISKAEFCVILNKVMSVMNQAGQTGQNTIIGESGTSVDINNVSSLGGTIEKYFESMNVLQVNISGETKLYKIYPDAEVKINGIVSSAKYLSSGMSFSAVINNSMVIQLQAVTVNGIGQTDDRTETTTETQVQTQTPTVPSVSDTVLSSDKTASGNIAYILIDGSNCIIGLNSGTQTKYFNVDTDKIPVYALKTGDNVSISAEDGTIKSLKIESDAVNNIKIGFIESVKSDYIVFVDEKDLENSYKLYFDEDDTYFFDIRKGKEADKDDLEEDIRVYLIMDSPSSSDIKTIVIMDK